MGDHECIHCGECISVCPTKAISFKGAKLFVRGNDLDAPTGEIKPLASMLKNTKEPTHVPDETQETAITEVQNDEE